jgi:hypothetical protein
MPKEAGRLSMEYNLLCIYWKDYPGTLIIGRNLVVDYVTALIATSMINGT